MTVINSIPFYISLPSEDELRKDIAEAEAHARAHPNDAEYDRVKEEIFKKQLAVLEENPQYDPNTQEGAEALLRKMDEATKDLSAEANALLLADTLRGGDLLKEGFSMGHRHWIQVK